MCLFLLSSLFEFFLFTLVLHFLPGLLDFLLLFRFCLASQHHVWVFPLLLVLLQKLSLVVNVWHLPPPTAGSWWSQWGCYGMWSILYILWLKIFEYVYDHQFCLNLSSVFGSVISVFKDLISFSLIVADMLAVMVLDLKSLLTWHQVIFEHDAG